MRTWGLDPMWKALLWCRENRHRAEGRLATDWYTRVRAKNNYGDLDLSFIEERHLKAEAQRALDAGFLDVCDALMGEYLDRGPTLRRVRERLRAHLREGAICPCCDRKATIRRRSFTAHMAVTLLWLVRQSDRHMSMTTVREIGEVSPQALRAEGWVRWAQEAPRRLYRINEISRLVKFGVAERGDWTEIKGVDAGRLWYRPTALGRGFIRGVETLPAALEIYNDEVIAVDDKYIDVLAALHEKFDLDTLLAAALDDEEKWEALIDGYGDGPLP